MEQMQMVEKVEDTVNPRTSSANSKSPTDRSYLEVIDIDDDYLNPYQPIETNNQQFIFIYIGIVYYYSITTFAFRSIKKITDQHTMQ
jgi:hypothetical protein